MKPVTSVESTKDPVAFSLRQDSLWLTALGESSSARRTHKTRLCSFVSRIWFNMVGELREDLLTGAVEEVGGGDSSGGCLWEGGRSGASLP